MGVINLGILIKKIMGKISGAGYIKDTDYASSSKGGTIKVDSTYATEVTSGGKLKAKEITAEAYSEANEAAFISKATLDNVLAAQPASSGVIESIIDAGTGIEDTQSHNFTFPTGKTISDYDAIMIDWYAASQSSDHNTTIVPVSRINGVRKWGDGKALLSETAVQITYTASYIGAIFGIKF